LNGAGVTDLFHRLESETREMQDVSRDPLQKPAASDAASSHMVCVIDDDDRVRDTICKILRRAGFTVADANDGDVGIEIVARTQPSVVVTDIVMPNREGIETICELKKRFPAIRILAISGGGRIGPQDFLELAAALGADDCLAKPFRPAELLTKVSDLVARSTA
jgi:DNA-binding response OmpR family regulator